MAQEWILLFPNDTGMRTSSEKVMRETLSLSMLSPLTCFVGTQLQDDI